MTDQERKFYDKAQKADVVEAAKKWAEGTTAPGQVDTKSAKSWAELTEQIKTDIEALIPNFYDPLVQALRERVILNSANLELSYEEIDQIVYDIILFDPSLLLIPSAYQTGVLYSVKPSDGTCDFTVSRNGTATRVNKDGLIETVAANVPRLEFDPITGDFLGVLVENAATNLFLHSEDFSNIYWGNSGITVSLQSEMNPMGVLSISNIIENTSASTQHRFIRPISFTDQQKYTISIFVKRSVGTRHFQLGVTITAPNPLRAYYNLDTETIDNFTGTGTTGTIKRLKNDWFLCTMTFLTDGTSGNIFIAMTNSTAPGAETYTGDGVSSLYLWGAHLESGPVATSYIPTTTTQVTRPADIISKTGVSSLIGQTKGSIYIEVKDIISLNTAARVASISISPNNVSDSIEIVYNGSQFIVYLRRSNSATFPSIIGSVLNQNKIIVTYNLITGTLIFYLNGIKTNTINISTELFGSLLDTTKLFNNPDGSTFINGKIKEYILFKQVLSDSQAIALTTL